MLDSRFRGNDGGGDGNDGGGDGNDGGGSENDGGGAGMTVEGSGMTVERTERGRMAMAVRGRWMMGVGTPLGMTV